MDGIEKKKAKKQQSRVPFDTRLGMYFRLRIFDVLKVIPTNNRGKKISVLMTLDFTNE